MPKFDWKLILTGDNETPELSDIELEISSINYSINGDGTVSINATVEISDGISDRSNGILELYYKQGADEDYILLVSAALTKISLYGSPNRFYAQLNAVSEGQSFTQYDGNIEFDNIASQYTLIDGSSSFVTPVPSAYYVPGAVIEYDSIVYGISDISFSKTGDGAPSWTLKEGEIGSLSDDTSAAALLVSGVPVDQSLGYGESGYRYPATVYNPDAFSVGQVRFDGYYARGGSTYIFMDYYNFELEVESDVEITIAGAFTNLYENDPTFKDQLGFELVLANGEFGTTVVLSNVVYDQINSYKIDSCGTGETITARLPAGIYTVRPLNIAIYTDAPIEYTLTYTASQAE